MRDCFGTSRLWRSKEKINAILKYISMACGMWRFGKATRNAPAERPIIYLKRSFLHLRWWMIASNSKRGFLLPGREYKCQCWCRMRRWWRQIFNHIPAQIHENLTFKLLRNITEWKNFLLCCRRESPPILISRDIKQSLPQPGFQPVSAGVENLLHLLAIFT